MDPLFINRTSLSHETRQELGVQGALPYHCSSLDEQISRAYRTLQECSSPIAKYIYLSDLLFRNAMLFYRLSALYAKEVLPIIYTPTVGEIAQKYSHLDLPPMGLYLSYPERENMDAVFERLSEVDVIVVTDGERVLGLGDLGVGGIVISIGKLSLYSLFGGIHPKRVLPIVLDVGTNHEGLLQDPLYLGWRHQRIAREEYDLFIEQFVQTVQRKFPKALLQWEDFGKNNARRLLDEYRDRLLSFNDDIQGTASVTIAALLAAVQKTKKELKELRIVILGAGSAGTGIADGIALAMHEQGISFDEARNRIYLVDREGLIHTDVEIVFEAQRPYQKREHHLKGWKIANPKEVSLLEVIEHVRPDVLIGVSGQANAFTKEVVQRMHQYTKQPIFFPLSNPTSQSEAHPKDLIEWTFAEAVIATGSPFEPVVHEKGVFEIGQCNNVYIFPGLGCGALAARATKITDGMLLEASRILASFSPGLKQAQASLFPPITELRQVCHAIALGVGKKAIEEGVSKVKMDQLEKLIGEITVRKATEL